MTDPRPEDARDLRLFREYDAPRDLVWAVLTDPDHLERWWGPTGFRTVTRHHDLRVGGTWQFTMHGPDGQAYPGYAFFDAIEAPHRLVLRYVDDPGDAEPRHVTTLTLEEVGPRRTRFTLSLRFPSAEARRLAAEQYGAVEGGRQTLQRLADRLATLQGASEEEGFVVRRVLAAPRALVWDAWTDADRLVRWFHPEAWSIFAATLDLRVGGRFHYGFRGADFPEAWGLWRFTEVEPQKRLGFVLSFADAAGEAVPSPFGGPWPARIATTVTLEEHAGLGRGTVLTLRSVPLEASEEEWAAFRAMGPSMGEGWGQTLDSLAAFLAG